LNEIVAVPLNQNITEKSTLHNSKLIFLIPLVILLSNSTRKFSVKERSSIYNLGSDFTASIDIKNLNEKLNIIKKIGPYLPESIIEPLNSIIFFVEKATTIISLMEIITTNKAYTPIVPYVNLSNKDRISGILSTIRDEAKDEKVNNIKPVIDMALNIDKYKSLANVVSSLSNISNKVDRIQNYTSNDEISSANNSNSSVNLEDMINIFKPLLGNDENKISQLNNMIKVIKPMLENNNKSNQIENVVNAIKPALGNSESISSEKIGDMFKILELLNVLNSKKGNKEVADKSSDNITKSN